LLCGAVAFTSIAHSLQVNLLLFLDEGMSVLEVVALNLHCQGELEVTTLLDQLLASSGARHCNLFTTGGATLLGDRSGPVESGSSAAPGSGMVGSTDAFREIRQVSHIAGQLRSRVLRGRQCANALAELTIGAVEVGVGVGASMRQPAARDRLAGGAPCARVRDGAAHGYERLRAARRAFVDCPRGRDSRLDIRHLVPDAIRRLRGR
jgi:hypothetical protein